MVRLYSGRALTLASIMAGLSAIIIYPIAGNIIAGETVSAEQNATMLVSEFRRTEIVGDICFLSRWLDRLAVRNHTEPHTMFSILDLDASDSVFTDRSFTAEQLLRAQALILSAMKAKQDSVDETIDAPWEEDRDDDALNTEAIEAVLTTISGDFLMNLDARVEYMNWLEYDGDNDKGQKGRVNWKARCG